MVYPIHSGLSEAGIGGGGNCHPPDFGRSINLISIRGTDYAHKLLVASPSDFLTFRHPCGVPSLLTMVSSVLLIYFCMNEFKHALLIFNLGKRCEMYDGK